MGPPDQAVWVWLAVVVVSLTATGRSALGVAYQQPRPEEGAGDGVAQVTPQQVVADAAQGVGLSGRQTRRGEQGHVGDGVLVAGGDKASRHHQMAMKLGGPSVRSAIQMARQTSQLHRDALHKQGQGRCLGWASATLWARLPASGSRLPPPW